MWASLPAASALGGMPLSWQITSSRGAERACGHSIADARRTRLPPPTQAFRNRPYQSAVVFLSILNVVLLFAATTDQPWYAQNLETPVGVTRTVMTWNRLQVCEGVTGNVRTTNRSREVCSVVFLADIRLDQDYVRQAGWSAFGCNLVSLPLLGLALYLSYLARVGRSADVPAPCRRCLGQWFSPAATHAFTSVIIVSGFGSFSSIMLTNLPNDPTRLNPKFQTGPNDVGGFGTAYGLSVTVFLFELVCIALSAGCAKEEDRNPDDFSDAPVGGFPPQRGTEAAEALADVYGSGPDPIEHGGTPAPAAEAASGDRTLPEQANPGPAVPPRPRPPAPPVRPPPTMPQRSSAPKTRDSLGESSRPTGAAPPPRAVPVVAHEPRHDAGPSAGPSTAHPGNPFDP